VETVKLSSRGQVIIPKSMRESRHWQPGTEFAIEETTEGVLLRPLKPFKPTRHENVFGCLKYGGPPLSLEDMENAIMEEAKKHK